MRKPRFLVQNGRYHVIGRINNYSPALEPASIKELFLDTVRRAKEKYAFSIRNFCIMHSHVHLIVIPGKNESLSRIMQWILSVFAVAYNKENGQVGHVWYDRFKSIVILDRQQFADTFHYISNNPVKAGYARTPEEYEYNGVTFIKNQDFSIVDPPPDFCDVT